MRDLMNFRYWALTLSTVSLLTLLLPAQEASAWAPLASCEPVWDLRGGPNGWYLNEDGYSKIDFNTVENVMIESMDAWSEPCCSGWSARYIGLTDGDPMNQNDRRHIVGFAESTWPQQLGNANYVLAVTMPAYTNTCVIVSADMLFNGVRHTFTATGRGTDLGSIATHEFGHWVGLDHSHLTTATMYEAYVGGTSQRTLHDDDIEGVCSLYEGDCSCTTSADCSLEDQACINGSCVVPPCASNGDCPSGEECNLSTGRCFVPPCRSDNDCASNQVCDNGTCRRPWGDCAVCKPCSSGSDCPGSGVCQPITQGGDPVCVVLCGTDGICPGDSVCFSIPNQNVSICLNEDVNQRGPCHDDYVCGAEDLCEGVSCSDGQICDPRSGTCVSRGGGSDPGTDQACDICEPCSEDSDCQSGACAFFDGKSSGYCTQSCAGDGDCPGESSCIAAHGSSGVINLCLNPDANQGVCPSSFSCEGGGVCPSGTRRNPETGACESEAEGCTICNRCTNDASCGDGSNCLLINDEAVCTQSCDSSSDCPGDSQCYDLGGARYCLNPAANDGICPQSYTCDMGDDDHYVPQYCPICEACSEDSHCGPSGRCLSINGSSLCTANCDTSDDCEGDSVCYNLGGDAGRVCLNPNAESDGICPSDYRCTLPASNGDNTTASGCGDCAAGGSSSGTTMIFIVALALVTLNRRRRGELQA